jgi:hypothetical protein
MPWRDLDAAHRLRNVLRDVFLACHGSQRANTAAAPNG